MASKNTKKTAKNTRNDSDSPSPNVGIVEKSRNVVGKKNTRTVIVIKVQTLPPPSTDSPILVRFYQTIYMPGYEGDQGHYTYNTIPAGTFYQPPYNMQVVYSGDTHYDNWKVVANLEGFHPQTLIKEFEVSPNQNPLEITLDFSPPLAELKDPHRYK